MQVSEDVVRGQQVYNKFTLSIYDFLLFKVLTKFVWRCPNQQLNQLYTQCTSNNHLDVGVGSGYLLDQVNFSEQSPRLALMDLNQDCLNHTAARLIRYNPETYRRNILDPIEGINEKFDSISINFVLHCLPGTLLEKSIVFDHLAKLLNPNGVIFGHTILGSGVEHGWLAKRLLKPYNQKGVFTNLNDDLSGFNHILSDKFSQVSLDTFGSSAQFVVRK